MCGIVGIVGKSNVNQALYDALTVLQHRGQDAAGMVTTQNGRLFLRVKQFTLPKMANCIPVNVRQIQY